MACKRRRRFWRLHLGEQSSSHRGHRKQSNSVQLTRSNRINLRDFKNPREFRIILVEFQSSQPRLARKKIEIDSKKPADTLSNRKRLSGQRLPNLLSSAKESTFRRGLVNEQQIQTGTKSSYCKPIHEPCRNSSPPSNRQNPQSTRIN